MEVPSEWTQEVSDTYVPLRILGKGAFASVVLGKDKKTNDKVAIKVIGSSSDAGKEEKEDALKYALREVSILKQLDHPNVMKVKHYWDLSSGSTVGTNNTICIMALSYIRGPTVESLLNYGGALSNKFGRIVIAQVIDALAYLHYRGVIHRDIKPDNIMVTGAVSKDGDIWDNSEKDESFPDQLKKWKATLVDFGFARALKANEGVQESRKFRRESKRASYHEILNIDNDDGVGITSSRGSTIRSGITSSRGSTIRAEGRRSSKGSRQSVSHKVRRKMSAVGNRLFAAPEIINKVHQNTAPGADSETISEYVADYGMLVDSYSMGHTIRYMMTGVMPNQSVEEAIMDQNSLCRKLCRQSKSSGRSVKYRDLPQLPEEVRTLIKDLTQVSEKKRLSIRKARQSVPWIKDVFGGAIPNGQRESLSKISYLTNTV